MSERVAFTIEGLCKFMTQGRLMAGKCRKCGKVLFPPRGLCDRCLSTEFDWVELSPKGKLLTYTVIHVAPSQFQSVAPYPVGILEFEHDVKIPGMIRGIKAEELKVGMSLGMDFEACVASGQWPQWPRYYFKPV